MNLSKVILLSIVLSSLSFSVTDSAILAALPDPALQRAKQKAETNGYTFFTSHDDVVAEAKKELKLRDSTGLEPANFKLLIETFRQKYPFVTDIYEK